MSVQPLDRRAFLRGAGVALALPLLDAMAVPGRAAGTTAVPRRLVAVCTTLGIHGENLFPTKAGKGYPLTPYLEPLKRFQGDLTVFSGLSHPEVDGGHSSEACFLTAAPHPGQPGFRNSISLDQFAVEKLAPDTRFSSLQMTTGGFGLSVSRSGVVIPPERRPSMLFRKLFVNGTPAEVDRQVARLKEGQSVMDAVLDEAKALHRAVGPRDRDRLDQYFSSVREVEERLLRAERWARKPKPVVAVKPPTDIANATDIVARSRLLFDLVHLAIQTDSTRFLTISLQGHNSIPPVAGVTQDWHNLSHHGKDPEKLAQLRKIELEQMKVFAELIGKLKASTEGGETLLDRTAVLYGSNLGNASSHDTKNLPIVLLGGGFKHGQHLAFDTKNNTPLCNLYVSLLQRLGVKADRFASGTTTLAGLEIS